MPHLLNVWPRVSSQIGDAPHVLLLSDYDGTLAPIAPTPERATLPPATRNALVNLQALDRFTLGIVSGRALSDVRKMVGIEGLIYAGNHGLEVEGPDLEWVHPKAAEMQPTLARIFAELERRLSPITGTLVEGKGLTLSVHYRLTPAELVSRVQSEFSEAVDGYSPGGEVRVTRGKELLEVRPNLDWHKGRAIAMIAQGCPPGTLAIYLGDDLTDEDGFAAVHELNGMSVFVGAARQPTRAQYRVDSPAEVAETLKLMARL